MADPNPARELDRAIDALQGRPDLPPGALTQEQVDLLLEGRAAGPVARRGPEVRPYDFVRPTRLTRAHRVILEARFGRFAQASQVALTSLMRVPVDVAVTTVEQATFAEYVQSLETPCAAFDLAPAGTSAGRGVLDFETGFAFVLIERLFGGGGEPGDLRRALTPIEQRALRALGDRLLAPLSEAFPECPPPGGALGEFESNPDLLRATAADDLVLVAALEVRFAGAAGPLTLCLPLARLEPVLAGRVPAPARAARPREENPEARRDLAEGLRRASLGVAARLPAVRLPARALFALRPGQVLRTPLPVDGAVEVHVNGRVRFHASLGQVRGRVGLRVTRPARGADAARAGRGPEGRIE